jgi:dipeptidyl aminopeptidase/acylaminoacyl peptidase
VAKQLLRTEDLLNLKFAGDPRVSPAKDRIAYVLTEISKEKDGYYSSIYFSDTEGKSEQLTYHGHNDHLVTDVAPRWSPDGKQMTFISNRSGSNQVWLLPVGQGGEAVPLTNFQGEVVEHAWSPDGKKLALTVEEKQNNKSASDVKVITRLRYKADGTSSFLESRKHIYLMDLETNEVTRITSGDVDFYKPCFSPDSKRILYLGSKDSDQELTYIPSIWEYDVEKKKETLFHRSKGTIRSIAYSPDGKWAAFIGHDKGEHLSYNLNVWIISTTTKEVRNVSAKLDRPVDNVIRVDARYETGEQRLIWDSSSQYIYFLATDHGGVQLYRTDIHGNVSQKLSKPEHTITSFDMIDDKTAVFIDSHKHATGDLVLQSLDDTVKRQQLTMWNEKLFNSVQLSEPEHITFTSVDDVDIEGWLLKPTQHKENKQVPLILQIHGGPHSAYGYGFQFEWQVMAAAGYAVLYFNPRGSQGYGQDFAKKVIGDMAGKDYEDIMNGLDYVLDAYPCIDKDNLFVTGESYGGYMTNMIVTRTNRFKAAICQNSVTNLYSKIGTSDIGFHFNRDQMNGADLWEEEALLMRYSPIRYARNVTTPMLVMHSEEDYRCPIEQGEQWYLALRRLGVETKFIRFPNESHNLMVKGTPSHRLERMEHLLKWFEEYRS